MEIKGLFHKARRRLARTSRALANLGAANAPLIAAAANGATEVVEGLLLAGADPNTQNRRRETALHRAVSNGHHQTAACLLHYGANPAIADKHQRTPLTLDYTGIETLHAIRQRHRRFRTRASAGTKPASAQVAQWLGELDRTGFVKVSGLVSREELSRLQHDFGQFILNLEPKIGRGEADYKHYDEEEHWWAKDRAYVSNNAFKHSTQLVKLCCHADLVELANLYFGRTAFITRGVAMRYLPNAEAENDMFGWHHDMEEKRLKLLILLTDVGQRDQYMSYVLGSHKIYHPYEMFFRNNCSLEYCRKQLHSLEIGNTIGQAGDVFLFDSNGAHRGNRRPDAAVRDAFFIEYTIDRSDIWGGDIPGRVFDDIPLSGTNPFERMMSVEKKWNAPVTRKAPAWVESLPQVESWLHTGQEQRFEPISSSLVR